VLKLRYEVTVKVLMLSMATKIAAASSCTQFGFMAKFLKSGHLD
jgi:hypothetical protein